MNIDIRSHIVNNFKGLDRNEIRSSIDEAVSEKEELALPGFGVFFELLWSNANDALKAELVNLLFTTLNKDA